MAQNSHSWSNNDESPKNSDDGNPPRFYQPYHDDSDQDDQTGPDAPLRPSTDFDELSGRLIRPSRQENVSARIPPQLKSAWGATVHWIKGPRPPRIYQINPILPAVQHAPIALLDRYVPKRIHRFWLLSGFYAVWLLVFSFMLWRSSFAAQIPGYGTPLRLGCLARYWNDFNGCGLNGDLCRPFSNASLAFRCPADCHKVLVLNPHAVGDEEVIYQPLVVGGPSDEQTGFEDVLVENAVYRSDSFICASATHSGYIRKSEGGCGVLTLTGEQTDFSESRRHGIKSTRFDSYFPQSFGFLSGTRAQCKDLRWPTLAVSVVFTSTLSLFTTHTGVHFWTLFVALFFHVALVSDPPLNTTYVDLVSIALGRFLPACFCAWVTYRYTAKRSLEGLTAQIEKTILWLGAAWVGSLNNYTFDKIPIQRLTPHDIKAQPGAVPALIIIVLALVAIAVGQAWSFRVEGRMPRYLFIYGIMVLAILIMLALPTLSLRIHHYILALLFLPGTSFQNRRSLFYQGLLIGLFINGVARWGFAPILETPASLVEEAPQDTLLPTVSVLAIGAQNITFSMGSLPVYDSKIDTLYDGISVLVNDVERFRGYSDDRSYWDDVTTSTQDFTWTWTRHRVRQSQEEGADPVSQEDVEALAKQLPEYFRFGYMSGNDAADFTKAGKWTADGTWVDMQSGPSV